MIEKEMVVAAATEITTVIVTNGNSQETTLITVVVLPKKSSQKLHLTKIANSWTQLEEVTWLTDDLLIGCYNKTTIFSL